MSSLESQHWMFYWPQFGDPKWTLAYSWTFLPTLAAREFPASSELYPGANPLVCGTQFGLAVVGGKPHVIFDSRACDPPFGWQALLPIRTDLASLQLRRGPLWRLGSETAAEAASAGPAGRDVIQVQRQHQESRAGPAQRRRPGLGRR